PVEVLPAPPGERLVEHVAQAAQPGRLGLLGRRRALPRLDGCRRLALVVARRLRLGGLLAREDESAYQEDAEEPGSERDHRAVVVLARVGLAAASRLSPRHAPLASLRKILPASGARSTPEHASPGSAAG